MSFGSVASYSSSWAAPQSEAAQLPPLDTERAADWIRAVWGSYVELWPKILGLQHEAAELAATSPPGFVKDTARAVVEGCAELMQLQTRVQKAVESYAGYLGLGAVSTVTAAVVFSTVALIILWSFRRYDALSELLEGVRAGYLGSDEAAQLLEAAGPLPDITPLGGIGLGALLGVGAVLFLLWKFKAARFELEENPPLYVLGANPQPDGVWSNRVLTLDYVHEDDGQPYTHDFRPGVRMQALEDGSVRLYHPRRRIWREF